MRKRMKNRMIIGVLMVCCMALVTAVGCTFARKLAEEKSSNIFLASEHNNMKIHDKITEYKNKNSNGKAGDHLQALVMAQIFIVKAIDENPVIISR